MKADLLQDRLRIDVAKIVPPVILRAQRLEASGVSIVHCAGSTYYGTDEMYCSAPQKPMTKMLTASEAEDLEKCRKTMK